MVRLEAEKVFLQSEKDPSSFPYKRENFEKNCKVDIQKLGKNFIEFDLIGVSPAISNSIRRIAISEIPTIAIESVFVINNTSIIPDEVLAHRLGLVPIHADARKFDYLAGEPTDVNTIVFELREKCSADKDGALVNEKVLSKSLRWVPQGSQLEVFGDNGIKSYKDDILLVKLRPGQEIDLELHAIKGIGKDHAKWSPVSCASYRLMPRIEILSPITGEDAQMFQKCFPIGVIGISSLHGIQTAVVENPRKDTVSRECLRHPEFATKVCLSRDPSHFIFHVETVSNLSPEEVIMQSFQILIEKCRRLRTSIDSL